MAAFTRIKLTSFNGGIPTAVRRQLVARPHVGNPNLLCVRSDRKMPKIGPLPGHVVDAARVSAMLDHVARSLFVGVLNDGFSDPATGLCLSAKADRSAPAMASAARPLPELPHHQPVSADVDQRPWRM